MKLITLLVMISVCTYFSIGQKNLKDLNPSKDFENILVKKIGGDKLSTQFIIWVKDTVRTHRHEDHSESLYVIEGNGIFYLNHKQFIIGPGDFITINKKSWHAVKVTSEKPLKVLSVQSPEFLGEDRTFKHQ